MAAIIAPMDCVRIDKWLWAARFFKTRTLAADAVKGGRVELGGARVKASKEVAAGDELKITIGQTRRVVVVRGVSDKRGPAKVATMLYEETAQSIAERELAAEQRRLQSPPPGADLGMRPTKRDRRRLDSARGGRR
ncbi:MAG: ribosome-associated heat shock protein Hsp15 [Solirubrobacteraceae bacterium]|jgi:ribosome-associated heat shock protein Hsp15|nr:ribosome-associated heat shock protein Hsp15 [Solirubrobacteraceae bacterium]